MTPSFRPHVLSASAVCLVFVGCQSAPFTLDAESDVRNALQAWTAAFNDCSADKAATLYAPDAHLWGTVSQELIATPEAIRQYFARACASSIPPKITVVQQVVRLHGDSAVNSGTYTFTLSVQGQSRQVPARFSFAYRKVDAHWLIVSHHSSPLSAPPQSASAPAR